eukprot:8257559-Alexandrium_andersonii.AAC.1
MLSAAANVTAAFHCLRLLCDGLKTASKRRDGAARDAHPHRCLRCSAEHPRFVLRSPEPEEGPGARGAA